MPRTWASGDNVFLPIGGLVGVGSSANTLVAIAKKASDSSWMTPTAIQPSAGNPTVSIQVSSTNKLSYVSGATDKDTGITWQASDGWSLIAVDKAGGTATPNGHLYVYGTNTWTHSAAASTVGGNSTDLTGGKVQHGRWATGDPFIGDLAIAGIWKRQLGQTEIEYLAFSLQQWYASAPDYLVIFDQAATSMNVIDLITGNTEQSHSGAAVSTNSVPVFSYGFTIPRSSFVAAGGTDATATPSTVSVSATVPASTVSTGSTVTATAVAGVAAVPAQTVATGSTVTATAVTAAAVVPAPTVATGSTVTATAVALAAVVPTPAVTAGGNATATPSAVSVSAAVPAPSVATGSTITATSVAGLAAVPTPTVATGSAVTASAVTAAAVVPAPTVSANATATPSAVAVVVAIQSVTVSVGSTATPVTVAALASVPTPGTGVVAKATSTASVTDGRGSTAAVTAGRTSTPTVGGVG